MDSIELKLSVRHDRAESAHDVLDLVSDLVKDQSKHNGVPIELKGPHFIASLTISKLHLEDD